MTKIFLTSFFLFLFMIDGFTQVKVRPCRFQPGTSAESMMMKVTEKVVYYNDSIQEEFKRRLSEKFISKQRINHDSIFSKFLDTLKKNLGPQVFCQNTYLNYMSFDKVQRNQNETEYWLSVGFDYPLLDNKSTGFKLIYYINPNGTLTMRYPDNFIYCNNTNDCNIKITEEKLESILKDKGFIKEGDKHYVEVKANQWNISVTNDGWIFRHVSVNMQTGEISKSYESHRID